jgi:hypothetical protein
MQQQQKLPSTSVPLERGTSDETPSKNLATTFHVMILNWYSAVRKMGTRTLQVKKTDGVRHSAHFYRNRTAALVDRTMAGKQSPHSSI